MSDFERAQQAIGALSRRVDGVCQRAAERDDRLNALDERTMRQADGMAGAYGSLEALRERVDGYAETMRAWDQADDRRAELLQGHEEWLRRLDERADETDARLADRKADYDAALQRIGAFETLWEKALRDIRDLKEYTNRRFADTNNSLTHVRRHHSAQGAEIQQLKDASAGHAEDVRQLAARQNVLDGRVVALGDGLRVLSDDVMVLGGRVVDMEALDEPIPFVPGTADGSAAYAMPDEGGEWCPAQVPARFGKDTRQRGHLAHVCRKTGGHALHTCSCGYGWRTITMENAPDVDEPVSFDEFVAPYVWRILRALVTGEPLDFKGAKVPLAVQQFLDEHMTPARPSESDSDVINTRRVTGVAKTAPDASAATTAAGTSILAMLRAEVERAHRASIYPDEPTRRRMLDLIDAAARQQTAIVEHLEGARVTLGYLTKAYQGGVPWSHPVDAYAVRNVLEAAMKDLEV